MRSDRAFTLIELLVAVGILAVVAGLVLGRIEFATGAASEKITRTTLYTIRSAILGTEHGPGYLTDVGELPDSLNDLIVKPAHILAFNPISKRGWNGPYLTPSGMREEFPSGGAGLAGKEPPTVLDAWRHGVVLQRPPGGDEFARLVSKGQDGLLKTPLTWRGFDPDDDAVKAVIGDDLVLFLDYVPESSP